MNVLPIMTPPTPWARKTLQPPVAERHLEAEVAHCVGGVVSPLLVNIALHVLDVAWARGGSRLGKLIRFADDFVVLCASQPRVDEARRRVAAILAPLGLRLHPDKTRIVQLTGGGAGL